VKFFYKTKKLDLDMKISQKDIENSNTILFSVFTRYGDGIIAFTIIKEFILKYINKNYILITNPQHYPYAKEILKEFSNIEIKYVNKRNTLSLFFLTKYLKKKNIDLGFNPLSFGDDSIYFTLFAKKYSIFKYVNKFSENINHYDKVRIYFNLEPKKEIKIINFKIKKDMKVLIAPFSTEYSRSLSIENIKFLQNYFKNHILALPKDKRKNFKNNNLFIFEKSKKSSQKFINLLKEVDLFIGVDSGPLHIACLLYTSPSPRD
jgi:ADP-heptose:LPS heptosyltransferase